MCKCSLLNYFHWVPSEYYFFSICILTFTENLFLFYSNFDLFVNGFYCIKVLIEIRGVFNK